MVKTQTKNINVKYKNQRISTVVKFPSVKNLKLLIILHGWNSHKDKATYLEPERFALNKGYATVRFDFPGHGESSGSTKECNIQTSILSLSEVINHLRNNFSYKINISNIAILANSFSGEVALLAASRFQSIKKLILTSPGLGKNLAKTKKNSLREYFWDNIKDFTGISFQSYIEYMKQIKIPVYIIHGKQDKQVPKSSRLS